MKSCCALRFALRAMKVGVWRTLPDSDHFTCSGCGQSFIRRNGLWEPISTADDITDLMAQERQRQQQDEEPPPAA